MNSIIYKVYLENNDSSFKAIRKFNYTFDFKTCNSRFNFDEFCKKIRSKFPELSDKEFTVSWKDDDGDRILISSSEELEIANSEMKLQKKMYVKLLPSKQEIPSHKKEKAVHSGICCNGCDNNIIGFRYKCIQCEDYDLCAQCETAEIHSHHYMIRMPQPLPWYNSRSFFHYLRRNLKKNVIHFNKTHASDENTSQSNHCSAYSWFGTHAPYLNSVIDTVLEARTVDPKSSKSHKCMEKKESKDNRRTDENESRKFPGEGRKLLDNAKDYTELVSDASTASQDSATSKVTADEWTIIDKNDTTEVNQTSSASSNMNGTGTKQTCSAPTAPPSASQGSSTETLYPELPRETKVINHQNPIINEAVETMMEMGFSNQSGLLTYLLGAENGNINNVLEILQPTNK